MEYTNSAGETVLRRLSNVLSRYHNKTRVETRTVEYTDEVEKEIVEEKTITETKTVDQGPHPLGYAILIVGVAGGVILGLSGVIGLGVGVSALGVIAGGTSLWFWRQHEVEEEEHVEEVPKTTVEEVSKTKTIEEEVPDKTQVVRAGRGTLSFQAMETPEGAIARGPDTVTESRSVSFPTIKDPQVVFEATEAIEETLEEIPWVLDGSTATYAVADERAEEYGGEVTLRGEEESLRRYFDTIRDAFRERRSENAIISALVSPALFDQLAPLLNQSAGADEASSPILDRLDAPDGRKLETLARQWESRWSQVNLALLEARKESLFEQVGPDCYELGQQVGYATFNFYCPYCNEDTQEELLERDYGVHHEEEHEPVRYSDTTRCEFLPERQVWRCKTCEKITEDPIPVHRMLDDVLLPAYDHLMQENKNERLRIHAKARDQERELQEKAESEIDSIRREHMSKIFALSEEIERYQATIAGEREAITSMEELVERYETTQEAALSNIDRTTQKMHREVQEMTERVLSEVDRRKKQEMEALSREFDVLSKAQRIEDERRDAYFRRIAEASEEQVVEQRKTRGTIVEQHGKTRGTIKEQHQKTRGTIEEEHQKTRGTFEEVGGNITDKLNDQLAHDKAMAKKKGYDTDDRSAFRLVENSKDTITEVKGTLQGKSSSEIEKEKLQSRE